MDSICDQRTNSVLFIRWMGFVLPIKVINNFVDMMKDRQWRFDFSSFVFFIFFLIRISLVERTEANFLKCYSTPCSKIWTFNDNHPIDQPQTIEIFYNLNLRCLLQIGISNKLKHNVFTGKKIPFTVLSTEKKKKKKRIYTKLILSEQIVKKKVREHPVVRTKFHIQNRTNRPKMKNASQHDRMFCDASVWLMPTIR